MPIYDLFSKRAKANSGEVSDVYQYDTLPDAFRVQVCHIWKDAIGDGGTMYMQSSTFCKDTAWARIHEIMCREKGVFALTPQAKNDYISCVNYILQAETPDAIDIIETTFRWITVVIRAAGEDRIKHEQLTLPDSAIKELNGRFREHRIGYEFVDGQIIRIDSQFLHSETTKEALKLLCGAGSKFKGALDEFMEAYAKHTKGDQKTAIIDACKALESTLKSICTERRWAFDPHKDTAKTLIDIAFKNNLIPDYLESYFSGLRATLTSGIPTIRNKTSGHGQGTTPVEVPTHFASYVLHMTASAIVFLINCHMQMHPKPSIK